MRFLYLLTVGLLLATSVSTHAQDVGCAAYDPDLAQTYTLGTVNNDLATDLRTAIDCANADADLDTILIPAQSVLSYDAAAPNNPDTATPPILEPLTLTSDGRAVVEVLDAAPISVFEVFASSGVTLANLTLRGGNPTGDVTGRGGGIDNRGGLLLLNMNIVGNRAGSDGGGIYHDGTSLTLVNTLVAGNGASVEGGGLRLRQDATIYNSTITGNRSDGDGGGLHISDGAQVTVINSIIVDNLAAGAALGEDGAIISGTLSFQDSLYDTGGYFGNEADDGGNVKNQAPLFVNAIDALGAPNTLGDYRVLVGSPAVDAGNTAQLPTELTLNFDLNADNTIDATPLAFDVVRAERVQGLDLDMGAFEGAVEPQTLVTTLSAQPDHVLQGETSLGVTLTNAIPDSGLVSLDALLQNTSGTLSIVYSADATCDANDQIVAQTPYDFAGDSTTLNLDVTLPLAILAQDAEIGDFASQGPDYVSQYAAYLCALLIADLNELATPVDAVAALGQSSEDIVYFPWDADGDGEVSEADVRGFYAALGNPSELYDYDGNGVVGPGEVVGALLRLGYTRNNAVIE